MTNAHPNGTDRRRALLGSTVLGGAVLLTVIGLRNALPEASQISKPAQAADRAQSVAPLIVLVLIAATALIGALAAYFRYARQDHSHSQVWVLAATRLPRPNRRQALVTAVIAVVLAVSATAAPFLGLHTPWVNSTARTENAVGTVPADSGTGQPPDRDRTVATPPPHTSHLAYAGAASGALILLAIVGLGVVIVRSTHSPPSSVGDTLGKETNRIAQQAVAQGLKQVRRRDFDPRRAVIACYATMEQAIAHYPWADLTDADTPYEVLAKAVRSGAVAHSSAAELVELFSEARYSEHPMTEQHRAMAAELLSQILEALQGRG